MDRRTNWRNYGQTSRWTSLLTEMRWHIWKPRLERPNLSNSIFLPSRDPVDDRFQYTLYILTGIRKGYLNLWAQGFLIYMHKTHILCFHSILINLSFIRYFSSWWCSWRPIPAHPQCLDWRYNGIVEFASSRAFKWYAELSILYNVIRSRLMHGFSVCIKMVTTTREA